MKIIFRIIIILSIAALVAWAFTLAFGGSTNSGQFSQRFEEGGGQHGGSLGGGLLGMFSTFLEIAAIVGLITFLQNGFKYLQSEQARNRNNR